MKNFLAILIPVALLGACQTLPVDTQAPPAPVVAETTPEPVEDVAPVETTEEVATPAPVTGYIQYQKSPLLTSLVSDTVMGDDVALMGLLSGTREYCGLDWQPGFVAFINIANGQGLSLEKVADDHGYYSGAAKRALTEAAYECSEQDFIELRAIDPY